MSKALRRAQAIMALRRRKAEDDVARVMRGIAAGESLKSRLIGTDSARAVCPDLTIGYVVRTVAILERGLAVLAEQSADALARLERSKQALERFAERAEESARAGERRDAESAVGEFAARRTQPPWDKAQASERPLDRAVSPPRRRP